MDADNFKGGYLAAELLIDEIENEDSDRKLINMDPQFIIRRKLWRCPELVTGAVGSYFFLNSSINFLVKSDCTSRPLISARCSSVGPQ